MPRTSASEVKEIMPRLPSTFNIGPFITAATIKVDWVAEDNLLTDNELKELERQLTAHMVALINPEVRRLSMPDGVSKDFNVGQMGKGLEATTYGQIVLMLDRTGKLGKDFKKDSIVVAPYAGGISIADKESRESDSDRVRPAFTRDDFAYPGNEMSRNNDEVN